MPDQIPGLHIGIDASRAARSRRTGTERYSLEVIRGMLSSASPHRFSLYTDTTNIDWLAGAPVRATVRALRYPRLWTHVGLSLEMWRRPPDVLFVPAHVLPLWRPRASVVTIHDVGYRFYPRAHPLRQRLYLELSTWWSVRVARLVIADSEATRRDLMQAYRVPGAKIRTVYPGRNVSLERVIDPGARAAVRQRYVLPESFLLYVGTLQPRKNLVRVVEAFAAARSHLPETNLHLVLAGDRGWLYNDLMQRVRALALESVVCFPGFVADDELPALLSAARGLVFPSLYEGFGFPVLEAQSVGVPVMTSATSSLPEVAGDAALLVDPHDLDELTDAMVRLVTDEALRQELIERGYQNVKRFSWERCAQEVLAALEEAATETAREKN